jgi:hypothetical protein
MVLRHSITTEAAMTECCRLGSWLPFDVLMAPGLGENRLSGSAGLWWTCDLDGSDAASLGELMAVANRASNSRMGYSAVGVSLFIVAAVSCCFSFLFHPPAVPPLRPSPFSHAGTFPQIDHALNRSMLASTGGRARAFFATE